MSLIGNYTQFPVKLVVFGCDHGASALKEAMMEHVKAKGIEVMDVGTYNNERCDYPDIAEKVCKEVLARQNVRGIVLCGTGIGISIAANKHDGIRCALCHDHYTARMCREHNDANVLALGGRTTGDEVAKEIVDEFLNIKYEHGRHDVRIEKMAQIEQKQKAK